MAWELDASHSYIEFSAKHMMFTTVKGRFDSFQGIFELDEERPEKSDIEVTIDVASLNTGSAQRDGHLRSADFFDSENYPTAKFVSKTVEKVGDEKFRVLGDLTIRDTTHEVELDVTVDGFFTDMQGKRRAAVEATTSFNRKDFNLNWNVALESGGWLVGEKVTINIEAQVIAPVEAPVA